MKKAMLFIALGILTSPLLRAQTSRVEAYFTNTQTKSDLMNIKAELAAQKVRIEYTHYAFDVDGHLSELAISVECQDSFKGSASTKKVPAAGEPRFGFYWDQRPSAVSPFDIGTMKE